MTLRGVIEAILPGVETRIPYRYLAYGVDLRLFGQQYHQRFGDSGRSEARSRDPLSLRSEQKPF